MPPPHPFSPWTTLLVLLVGLLTTGTPGSAEAFAGTAQTTQTESPAPLDQQPPVYPTRLLRKSIEGSCVVRIVVGPDGRVVFVRVVETTHRLFEDATLAAAAGWRFTPARTDHPSANVQLEYFVRFRPAASGSPSVAIEPMADLRKSTAMPALRPAAELAQAFSVAEVDRRPEPSRAIPPEYPAGAKREGREGKVVLQVTIDSRGCPWDGRVISSSDPSFEEPSLLAVRQWRFRPAQKNGRPVACVMELPLRFLLDSESSPAPENIENPPAATPGSNEEPAWSRLRVESKPAKR